MLLILLGIATIIASVILIKGYLNLVDAFVKSGGKCYINPFLYKAVAMGAIVTAEDVGVAGDRIQMLLDHYSSGVVLGKPFLPTYFICHPDHLKFILNPPCGFERGATFLFCEGLFDLGLIGSSSAVWKSHRKPLQSIMKLFDAHAVVSVFFKHTLELMEKCETFKDGEEFDCVATILPCIISGIAEHVLGIQMSNEDIHQFHDISKRAALCMVPRFYKIWFRPKFIFDRTKGGKEHRVVEDYCNNYMRNIVNKRKQEISSSTTSQSDENTTEGPPSMVDLMLQSKYKFSERELISELNSTVYAGFDTTAHGLCFLMYLVANHSEVQEKLYDELHEIHGNSDPKDNPTTADDLTRMEYMDRVLKEALRLFPPLSVTMRHTLQPVKMGDIHIPRGSDVIIFFDRLHRSEEFWPNPLDFVPDRFLPDHPLGPRHPFAYAPFGLGPRNCIGSKYATNAIKIVLATLLRRYVFKTKNPKRPADIEIVNSVATLPRDPLMMYFERRVTRSL